MLGIEVERGVHRPNPGVRRRPAMQQVQKMAADGVIVGFDKNMLAVMAVVIPVSQHRAERGDQAIRNIACTGDAVIILFRQRATQHGHTGSQHVHPDAQRRATLPKAVRTIAGRPRRDFSFAL